MNSVLKNSLAIVAGIIVGSIVNMSIIMVSGSIIAPPEGADITTMEGLKAALPLFEPKHFILPFAAHALGTFFGALTTVLIGASHKMKLALTIGVFFLLGGIANTFMIPAPLWFIILDLLGAYIPMSYLGGKLGRTQFNHVNNF